MRQLVDEHHVVRHPPLGDLALEELEQLLARDLRRRVSSPPPAAAARPTWGGSTPITAASATAGCATAAFSRSIELIHSPPDLITSLERSVICMKPSASMVATSPVGNQSSPFSSARSGSPPSPLKYSERDPGAAHQQVAERLAVPRQFLARVVHDLHVHAEDRAALLVLDRRTAASLASARWLDLKRADRAERAHLGHAPGVQHLHAVVFLEGSDHRRRAGRAADDGAAQGAELAGCSAACAAAARARPWARRPTP